MNLWRQIFKQVKQESLTSWQSLTGYQRSENVSGCKDQVYVSRLIVSKIEYSTFAFSFAQKSEKSEQKKIA